MAGISISYAEQPRYPFPKNPDQIWQNDLDLNSKIDHSLSTSSLSGNFIQNTNILQSGAVFYTEDGFINGNFGIGTSTPIGVMEIGNAPGSSGDGTLILALFKTASGGGHGFVDISYLNADANSSYASIDLRPVTTGYQNYNHLIAVQANASHASTGTLAILYEYASLPGNSGGRIDTVYGMYFADATGAGVVNNQYAIYIEDLIKGTTSNWAIYSAGSAPSYLGGQLQLATGTVSNPSIVGPNHRTGIWFQTLGEINMAVDTTDYFSLRPGPSSGIVVKSTMIANGPGKVDIGNLENTVNKIFTNSIVIGSGTAITKVIGSTATTLDFPSITTTCADIPVTLTGALAGDICAITAPSASVTATAQFSCWVSGSDAVTTRFCTQGTENPGSGAYRFMLTRFN